MKASQSAVTPPHPVADALFTRRFWLACAMHFSGAMALSLYILFPLFIRRLGGTEFTIGLYAGLTGAAAVVARLPVGRFLDTQGRRWVLAVAGVLHVVSWLGFSSITALGGRSAILVIMYGLASGSLFAAFFTYAADIIPVTRRSEGFGMFGIWGMLPNGIGPWLGEFLIARCGFRTYFLVAAVLALASVCLSLLLPETAHPQQNRLSRGLHERGTFPVRALLALLVTTFVFGAAVNGLFTFLAPFADATGRGGVGRFFMSYALSAVTVRVLTGRMPDRLGLRRVLAPALLLYAIGLSMVPAVRGSGLLMVGAMCGIGHGYAFPILSALVVSQVLPGQRGRAVSWLTAMFDLGNMLGNPVLGAIAEWAGYRAMFTLISVGLGATAFVAAWRPARILTTERGERPQRR